eukprot:TRINITY_DN7050_c0_g1_i5.p1 TRINITY_DN7050_c0_g1~~TRINITY_DN7050_c0_g1_i5.p1  ORF type:complete len:994 (-),score=156.00 TRINITY_DN7050_c0_g1_i5:384-3365(-)
MDDSLAEHHERGEHEILGEIWGWLQPGSVSLPTVLLRDSGVAIGRCKYSYMTEFWMQQDRDISDMSPLHNQTKIIEKLHRKNVGFVEVPDTRISRIHCTITRENINKLTYTDISKAHQQFSDDTYVVLRDYSSNGTFLNNQQLAQKGEKGVCLKSGDRVSLVMSVAPMAEHFYIYHSGVPDEPYFGEDVELDDGRKVFMRTESLEAVRRATYGNNIPYKLLRTVTTRYNGPAAIAQGEDDPICVICLSTPKDCVAVHPCGHSFCATCLSHHFGGLIDRGLQLSCPLRCSDCDRIIANIPLREALQNRAQNTRNMHPTSHTTVNAQPNPPLENSQSDQQPNQQHPPAEEQQQQEQQPHQEEQQQQQQQQQQSQQQVYEQILKEDAQQQETEEEDNNRINQASAADRITVISAAASNSPENTAVPGINTNADQIINEIDLMHEGSHRSVKDFENTNSQEDRGNEDFASSKNVPDATVRLQSGNESSVRKQEGGVGIVQRGQRGQDDQNKERLQVQEGEEGEGEGEGQGETNEETQPISSEGTYTQVLQGEGSLVDGNSVQQSVQQPTVHQEQSRRSSTASSPFLVSQEVNEQTSRYAEQSNGHPTTSHANMPQILESDTDENHNLSQQNRSITESEPYDWGQSNTERGALESNMELGMHESCPLYDDNLPVTMESLMLRQINIYVQKLREMYAEVSTNEDILMDGNVAIEQLLHALEVLARLGWSEDGFRQQIAQGGGLECAVGLMKNIPQYEGVQCAVCLFLMAMVRGDSEVCQANQWRIARENGVEAIVEAMKIYRHSRMVQLSCLLTLVPLAIENIMMQAHIARTARDEVIRSIQINEDDPEVVSKGLLALGVLLQGSDVVHDAIRLELYECGMLSLLAHVLSMHQNSEDLLWSAVFMSALMLKPNSVYFSRIGRRAVMCGLYTSLGDGLQNYISSKEEDIDEVIVTSGSALLADLAPLYDNYLILKGTLYAVSAGLTAILVGWVIFRRIRL